MSRKHAERMKLNAAMANALGEVKGAEFERMAALAHQVAKITGNNTELFCRAAGFVRLPSGRYVTPDEADNPFVRAEDAAARAVTEMIGF